MTSGLTLIAHSIWNRAKVISQFLPNSEILFDIELSALCNAKCIICPRDSIVRSNWLMQKENVFLLAERIGSFSKKFKNIKIKIGFCGMGECLLNSYLLDVIKFLREKFNMKNNIFITTNGYHLTKKMIRAIAKIGPVPISISFQGVEKDMYENVMKINQSSVLNNIRECIEHKIPLSITCVDLKLFNKDKIIKFWIKYNIDVHFYKPHTRCGYLKSNIIDYVPSPDKIKRNCNVFRRNFFVTSDGNVLPCCHDIEQQNVIGNILNESVQKILFKKVDILHKNRLMDFTVCQRCDEF